MPYYGYLVIITTVMKSFCMNCNEHFELHNTYVSGQNSQVLSNKLLKRLGCVCVCGGGGGGLYNVNKGDKIHDC